MKKISLIAFFLGLFISITAGSCFKPQTLHCTVDLDKAPQERWQSCVSEHVAGIERISKFMLKHPFLDFQGFLKKLEPVAREPAKYLGEEMAGELKGIAEASRQSMDMMVMFAAVFENLGGCTVAILQQEDGSVYMARNTDFFPPELKELLITVDFKKSNKTIFQAISFAGYPGVLVGYAKGRLGVALNQRGEIKTASEMEVIDRILKNVAIDKGEDKTQFITWELRQALQKGLTYEQAKAAIGNVVNYSSPAYISLIGPQKNEGVVFFRAPHKDKKESYRIMNNERLVALDGSPTIKGHFLAQDKLENTSIELSDPENHGMLFVTNSDYANGDERFDTLKNELGPISNRVSATQLFRLFSTPPIFMKEGDFVTLHTTIMNPKKDIFETIDD